MCLGGGMLNFRTHCAFPAFCEKCGVMFEANLLRKRISCPRCRGTKHVVPYDDGRLCRRKGGEVFQWAMGDQIGRDLILTDGDYLCPQCGRFTMSFAMAGCWD
jgi:DNA-directed RNA polymerase subunit RPC12/RpoP